MSVTVWVITQRCCGEFEEVHATEESANEACKALNESYINQFGRINYDVDEAILEGS